MWNQNLSTNMKLFFGSLPFWNFETKQPRKQETDTRFYLQLREYSHPSPYRLPPLHKPPPWAEADMNSLSINWPIAYICFCWHLERRARWAGDGVFAWHPPSFVERGSNSCPSLSWLPFEIEKLLENGCLSWLRLQKFRKQFEKMERADIKTQCSWSDTPTGPRPSELWSKRFQQPFRIDTFLALVCKFAESGVHTRIDDQNLQWNRVRNP